MTRRCIWTYRFIPLMLLVALSGCATYNRAVNVQLSDVEPLFAPPSATGEDAKKRSDVLLFVAFSGGGTRAAAFSYGVLKELRDTTFSRDGQVHRLLDEIDTISSVSGGSFTSAYYGLFGDRIFEDYEKVFLKRNVQKTLIHSLLNPINWFRYLGSGFDRSEFAIDYYDRVIFRGSTFGDMASRGGPRIEINATDLSIGERFGFSQARFSLLCSDLSQLKVARAVAASSAVPVAFAPIALANYPGCQLEEPAWLAGARRRAQTDPRLAELVHGFDLYLDKDQRRFIHLVDGGITDNLGIRAVYDRVTLLGGPQKAARILLGRIPRIIAIIVVNAKTSPQKPMDLSSDEPGTADVLGAVSGAQIQRFNVESMALMENSLKEWAAELSTDTQTVVPYFIQVDFHSIADPKTRRFFENVGTSLALPAEEVDRLTAAGRQLLQKSPQYQRLVDHIRSLY